MKSNIFTSSRTETWNNVLWTPSFGTQSTNLTLSQWAQTQSYFGSQSYKDCHKSWNHLAIHYQSHRKIKAGPIEKNIRKKFRRLYYRWLTTVCAKYWAICSQALSNLSRMCESQVSSLAQKTQEAGFTWTFNVHHATWNTYWFLRFK